MGIDHLLTPPTKSLSCLPAVTGTAPTVPCVPRATDDLYIPVQLVSFGAGNRRVGGYCLRPFLTEPLLKTRRFVGPITATTWPAVVEDSRHG